mmetsp:Transcript_86256/g.152491  ORF Transcript_86256/g.152491 Transcript_86256/m.152491 type:complete len:223 (-) Transcript_86256:149-817(-)
MRTRRAGSEPMSDSTIAANAPRGVPQPAWQASPMRSVSGDFAGPRPVPAQPAGFLMGAVPKAPQVRYVSPAPSPGSPAAPAPVSAPVLTVAAQVAPPLSSPATAPAASPQLQSPPSLPGRGSSSPPAYIGSNAVKAVPAKAPMPFMMGSGSVVASGFVSPFAYRAAAAKYPAPASPAAPQPLANNAREVLQRGNAPVSSQRPLSYSADVARQQSPAFRFAAP